MEAYTDGPAKMVQRWFQVRYGVWCLDGLARNYGVMAVSHERPSISQEEL